MKTVFFDVDTQIDFVFPAGALYVPGAEAILGTVSRLNHYAAAHQIPLVSTMDAHSENDPEFKAWPAHCVAGTAGQQKPSRTLLDQRIVVPNRRVAAALDGARQILLEKQALDCFTNVNLAALLDAWAADRYVVYGVVTEICVRCAAFGLLKTGKPVEIVTDAVRSLNDAESNRMFREFTAAGGRLTTASQVMAAV